MAEDRRIDFRYREGWSRQDSMTAANGSEMANKMLYDVLSATCGVLTVLHIMVFIPIYIYKRPFNNPSIFSYISGFIGAAFCNPVFLTVSICAAVYLNGRFNMDFLFPVKVLFVSLAIYIVRLFLIVGCAYKALFNGSGDKSKALKKITVSYLHESSPWILCLPYLLILVFFVEHNVIGFTTFFYYIPSAIIFCVVNIFALRRFARAVGAIDLTTTNE